jgi:hypothetical protein
MGNESSVSGTITADGQVIGPFRIKETDYGYVFLGAFGVESLGGGTVLIAKDNGDYDPTVLKYITSLSTTEEICTRLILPSGSKISVSITGSVSPNLYVEIASGIREK